MAKKLTFYRTSRTRSASSSIQYFFRTCFSSLPTWVSIAIWCPFQYRIRRIDS